MCGSRWLIDISTYLYNYIYMSSTPEHLGLLIKRLQYRHHRQLDEALTPLRISLVQWNALREIDRNPGSSQHRLAELTFNSDQAFGTLCNRLLQRGFIERKSGAGRALIHQLTPLGKALHAQGEDIHAKVIAKAFAPLDPSEQSALTGLLVRLWSRDEYPAP